MFAMIRKQVIESVPFARTLGIDAVEVRADGAVVRLSQRPELSNHVGTMHAGALFSLAEAASGLAMAGALAPVILGVRPVVGEASIRYAKPSRGDITARAQVSDASDALLATLKSEGRVSFNVHVVMTDSSGEDTGQADFNWHVRAAR